MSDETQLVQMFAEKTRTQLTNQSLLLTKSSIFCNHHSRLQAVFRLWGSSEVQEVHSEPRWITSVDSLKKVSRRIFRFGITNEKHTCPKITRRGRRFYLSHREKDEIQPPNKRLFVLLKAFICGVQLVPEWFRVSRTGGLQHHKLVNNVSICE